MDQIVASPRIAAGPGVGQTRPLHPARRKQLKYIGLGGLAVLGLAAVAQYSLDYWRVGRFEIETDDAYVQADNTLIAPRIAGYLSEVLVTDNQRVTAGQVLARIDDRDFQTALQQAIADRLSAVGRGCQYQGAIGPAANQH